MAASRVLGGAFGFVGSIVGAIGGSLLGSRAGQGETFHLYHSPHSIQLEKYWPGTGKRPINPTN